MSITFLPITAPEQKNGVQLGTLSISGYGAGTFQYYFGEVERFSFAGDKLYLGPNYHYDSETDGLVKYTSDNGSTIFFTGVDSIAVEFTETATGNSTWDYISLNFSGVDESISLSPVEFSGYDYGATFAKISSSGVETLAYDLASSKNIFEINGNHLKLKDIYYFDPLQSHIVDAGGRFYLVENLNDVAINSFQSAEDDINFRDTIEITSAFSGVKNTPIPYFAGTPTVEKLKTDVNTTDALLNDSPIAWASNKTYDNGTSTTITYSFVGTSDLYLFKDGYDEPDPKVDKVFALSAEQQSAVKLALDQYSNVADITFLEVIETASEVGTLRFGFTDLPKTLGSDDGSELAWGWATNPGPTADSGDIWISSSHKEETFIQGKDYNFAALMHEIGHALGLEHPFEGNDQLPTSQDFNNYTLMSYTAPENSFYYDTSGDYNYLISTTPMVYDIAAIQHLYGAATYNAGDTVYKYDPSKPFVEAIWDSGGYDTLDLSSFNKACTINLTPGAYSTIVCTSWSMTDNLGIAAGAVIEQAIGGSGNDEITGNTADNALYGGAGNDVISAGDGDDIIYCGTGNDTLTGGLGADEFRFYSGDGSNTITDFDVVRDTCSFYQLSGDKIAAENITVSTNNSGEVKYSLIDGTNVTLKGILEIPEVKTFTVSSSVVTRDGSKIADADVVISDGTNSSSYNSAADGSVSGTLTSGSASTVTGSLAYSSSTKAVSSQDALDALKLSVGLTTAAGTKTAFDFISADFNQDGKVSSQDALSILKYSVGLTTPEQAKWVFVDTGGDYSGVSKSNTSYTEGVTIADLSADTTIGLTGILIGDVNDSYSGLIA